MPSTPFMPPSFFIWFNLAASGRSCRTCPFFILAASFSASSLSSVSLAFSTRLTTSPMSRMRPATRSGWKGFQRVQLFAGAQELDRRAGDEAHRQRAAPPRPSPSTRVSMMPVTPTRSLKDLAMLTASWPVSAVGHQQGFMRIDQRLDRSRLRPSAASSTCWRPAVSRMTAS